MKKIIKLEGIFPALVVSFTEEGELDLPSIKKNVMFCLDNGCAGVVVNGSTGEAINLSREERMEVIKAAVEVCKPLGKTVIAGAGAATTSETLRLVMDAKDIGADAVLVITPFNNIPNKNGLIKHYTMVADIGLPVIMYNIPGHTGVTIDMNIFDTLIQHPNIIGMKDSSGDLILMGEIISKYGEDITLFTGCDNICLQIFAMGATAAILCLANVAPKQVVQIFNDVRENRLDEAREIYYKLLPIANIISEDVNFPVPVKEATRQIGHSVGNPRLPLTPVSKEDEDKIHEALKYAGII